MAEPSLLCDIFEKVYQKAGAKYCMVCFRTERRLVDGINVMKFKYFRQSNRLKSADNTRLQKSQMLGNCVVCYMCERQAAAAVKFCIAVNLSNKLHFLFSKMKLQPQYRREIYNLLLHNINGPVEDHKEAKELQKVLKTMWNSNNLLQTETLLLATDESTEKPSPRRCKMRDLLTFETKPVTEEDIFSDLASQPNQMSRTIFLEDDDLSNEEPQTIAVIHNPSTDRQKDASTFTPCTISSSVITGPPTLVTSDNLQNLVQNQTSMIIQPVLLNYNGSAESYSINHGTLTTLNNLNGPNLMINPLGNNIAVPVIRQFVSNNQLLPMNNLNQVIMPVNQNIETNQAPQKNKNPLLVTSVTSQNSTKTPTLKKTESKPEAEKMSTVAGVKRSDSNCQVDSDSAPTAVKTGKIDWEDKIPMDVISCVSDTDPTIKGNNTKRARKKDYTRYVNEYKDPVDNFIITDVKSINEMPQTSKDIIDLC